MFLKRFAVLTAALAIGVAACSGAGTTVVDPLPHGTAISSSGAAVSGTGVSGITSNLTVAGSGNVNASESSTPPNSLPVLSSVTRTAGGSTQSLKTEATTPNAPLVYVTITASATSTISGLSGSSFTFATAPTGSVFLAYFNGTQWVSIGPAGTVSGSTVTFSAVTFTPAISLAAGASLYLAVYTGSAIVAPTPTPSPSPSAGLPLKDAGFESGSVAPIGSKINSTGWTQCNVTSIANAGTFTGGINGTSTYTAATPFPLTTFTPSAGETPLASIVSAGATAPSPSATASPAVAATTVPVHGGTKAAQLGGLYNSFAASDVRYNGLCQNINVPSPGGHLSGFVVSYGDEGSSFTENLIGTLDTSAGNSLTAILYMENPETPASFGDTAYRAIGPITVPSGATTLFVGQATRAGTTGASFFGSYWWIDDLSIVSP